MSEGRSELENYMDCVLYEIAFAFDADPDAVFRQMGHWTQAGDHAALARCGFDMGVSAPDSAKTIVEQMRRNGQDKLIAGTCVQL